MADITREQLQCIKGVALLVVQDSKVLLGRRVDTKTWCVAGGSIEVGESFKEAAIRELYEEFGLCVVDATYIGVTHAPPNTAKPNSKDGCTINYYYEFEKGVPLEVSIAPREFVEYLWFDIHDVLNIPDMYQSTRHTLELFLRK